MSLEEEGEMTQFWLPAWSSGLILGLVVRGVGQKCIATFSEKIL